ncbi:glycolipid 2-alpha-mannosyltransferase-domain-containing protein [Mycena sp. CBHHK59/15]|nr:glycolipid 2-alpha-mannosyltransferase-domain-containing protein [Mycena sp. CBHHK59/15]
MSFSKRYTVISILAAAAMILYLAHSMGYRSLTPLPGYLADPPAYTAAVVYLVSVLPGPRNPDELLRSLPLMQMNIPWRHQWPPVRLSKPSPRLRQIPNLTPDATEKLVKRIEFVTTHHDLPDGIPANGRADQPIWDGEWPAYHHMCAFYSYKIFAHPRIKDLTYYLRLDDDSSVREPACFDPFEYMHVNNKSYAFRYQSPDLGWVTEGMWPFVSNYAQRHPDVESRLRSNDWEWAPNRLWPSNYGQGANFPSYETNFDLVKVSRFRTPEMTAFLDEIASDPRRFYWYRWGDAPVRFAEVYMFLDVAEEVHWMCEIPYMHKTRPFDDCECVPLLE